MGEKRPISKKKKQSLHALILIFLCSFPLMLIMGCGPGNCIKCSNCGDDNTRLFIYASGTNSSGVEYTSCVGPAGILGFGINSKCWPTECVKIKSNDGSERLSGCVTYYNEFGCLDRAGVKSNGTYSNDTTCLGVTCFGENYTETTAETTKATTQSSCFGIGCGGKSSTYAYGYNSYMPRQFTYGCWTAAEE